MPSETPFLPSGTAARRSYCKFAQKNLKDLRHFGTVDWRSRHVGCPLVAGEKWAATRWIHYKSLKGKQG